MFSKRLSVAMLAMLISAPAISQETRVELPFERVEADAPSTIEIWKGFGGDYIDQKDPNLNIFTATLTTPEGETLQVSQLNAPFVCGDLECPIRIVRAGKVVYDDGACRYTEQFFVNPSMRTLFACSDAIPTIEVPQE